MRRVECEVGKAVEQCSDIAPRLSAAATSGRDARQSLVALMHEIVDVLETNPLYRRLLTHPDEMEAVSDRIGPTEIDRLPVRPGSGKRLPSG